MNNFDKEFIMGLFLDTDGVSAVNRLTVAVANVINENNENWNRFHESMEEEYNENLHTQGSEDTEITLVAPANDYYEQVVLKFSDEDYEAAFRMKRSTVKALINVMRGHIQQSNMNLDKKVHIFLMFLVTNLSFNDTGKLFGLHKSSVRYIFYEIGSYLTEHKHVYINWPSVEKQHMTRVKINSRCKYPNCVGFIDACHLKYGLKHKKQDTVILQCVCDETLKFIDVHISKCSKLKKNKVFKDSALSQELHNLVEFDNHILGDSDYKIRMNLMTPFTSEEVLTSEEMKYNEVHWKAYSYIGHAFELLKDKFIKLNDIQMLKPQSINILLYSSCVLHNFIIIHEGSLGFKDESLVCDDSISFHSDITSNPAEKRQYLCNYITYLECNSETPR